MSSSPVSQQRLQSDSIVSTMEHSPGPAGIAHIPTFSPTTPVLRCCCGKKECAFLHQNNAVLEGVEKDLETAARLGQALLHRHESYMAEAEKDRHHLLSSIETLEYEKRKVEAENVRVIEENYALLEQLESLNKSVDDSDSYVKTLTATLESTQFELRRVTAAAARAVELEAQLSALEAEQMNLQQQLFSAQEVERSAVQRWKKAECTLRDLHDQVDRIEREAREERKRHAELMQRMDRRHAVERELDEAAGRLKGAAAASELGKNHKGTHVVSRFVRDILQDNATLQMGIMELREMLETSNQEVQSLREQILFHQPLKPPTSEDVESPDYNLPSTTLSEELSAKESRGISQELHIHHYYHTPSLSSGSKKGRSLFQRRGKKRRPVLGGPAMLPSAAETPNIARRPLRHSRSTNSSTSTILSQTSVSIPPPTCHQWSLQSLGHDSSISSSPRSAYRPSSVFDYGDHGFEHSQPTSPESTVLLSPFSESRRRKSSNTPFRSFSSTTDFDRPIDEESASFEEERLADHFERDYDAGLENTTLGEPVIPEEAEDLAHSMHSNDLAYDEHHVAEEEMFKLQFQPLRKSSSHESLFSVSGIDIHTPRDRPSRLTELYSAMSIRVPRRIFSPSTELLSTPPIISTTTITADKPSSSKAAESLLASVAAHNNLSADASSIVTHGSGDNDSTGPPSKGTTFGRVGGWVLGRWGMVPVTSTGFRRPQAGGTNTETETPSMLLPASHQSAKLKIDNSSLAFKFRTPGVNQKGPIFGLRPPPPAPVSIQPESLDEDLLQESLAE